MVSGHSHVVRPVILEFTEELSPGIHLIGFQRDFEFKAGQVIGLALEEGGPRRLYSICSGEQDPRVQVLYNVIEDGYLTPLMSMLEQGDRIWITAPRGSFTALPEPSVWVAAGTGIAPFYAMFRSGLSEGVTLIHGSRFLDPFYFYDEFLGQLGDRYIRCCSGEPDESVYHGRVTGFLEELEHLDTALKYYLCGSAEMVVDTRDLLIQKGVPFDRIISEIYF